MQKVRSCEKLRTFAVEMKKFCHISLSVLLSMALLLIGSGVNIMRCAHTGTVKIMTVLNSSAMGSMNSVGMDGMSCGMNSHCMSMEHVELSPTVMAQTVNYDFHVIQPLLAILPSLVAEWQVPIENKAVSQFTPQVWKSPPRDYLNFIQVLLI